MASSNKTTSTSGARRKSSKGSMIITLKLPSALLQRFEVIPVQIKEDSPSKESSAVIPKVEPAPTSLSGDTLALPVSTTPATNGTPAPSSMPPPTEGPKKKGVKRSAAVALGPDGLPIPKVRGKPGPKKKARLEDGSIDHSSTAPRAANGTAHKLGPKANQGAINAGLRALDRTGKPCRKWQKGGFTVKSFTGVVWEIPRWKAPPKVSTLSTSEGSASGESSKENKDNSQLESEKSTNDVDMVGTPASQPVSSPAPSVNLAGSADTPDTVAPTPPVAPVVASSPIVTASA